MMLDRLSMNIVNQLYDLAEVPVEKRQAINDEADAFVLRLLQQCSVLSCKELLQQMLIKEQKATAAASKGKVSDHNKRLQNSWDIAAVLKLLNDEPSAL